MMASAKRGHHNVTVRDTIIKLDSIRDRRLLRLDKKDKANKNKNNRPGASAGQLNTRQDTTPGAGGLKSIVKSVAEDSTFVDNENKITYLYGKARVTYEDFELDAEYIRVNEKTHLIFARGAIDPRTKRYVGRPLSKSKNEKPVASDSLLFDYKTKKVKIWNPASEQEGNFISGGQAKRLNENEVAYRNVIFSTCNLPYPDTHFGIVITKGIGEKKRIISGPAYLEIAGVPLPIGLPFGFFPKPDSRSSGVILPSFGEDQKLGFFLRNLGYYMAINDNIDLTTMATIYSRGSYEINTNARYLKRYKYGGSLTLAYGSHNYGLPGDPAAKDFNITWTHSQDPNANPGTTFSASVNAGTSTFYSNSVNQSNFNVQALTQNSLRSSINYGKTWANSPFNLNISLGHSQDLAAKTVNLELPTLSFNMATLSPFKNPESVNQRWYEKITVGYSLQATNRLNNIPESELFKSNTFTKRLQNGMQHTIPIAFNTTLAKFFQFNTSINYIERWYLQSTRIRLDRGSSAGQVNQIRDTVPGFNRAGEYSFSAGFSTKLYGTVPFKKGNIQAIRHITTPSISFAYRPDFGDPSYGYYRTAVSSATVPYPYYATRYSIFDGLPYGGPSPGKQAGLNFSLDNTIEAKVKPKSTDTTGTPKKIPILQGLTFSTFYNFAADSLKLSPINFNGHTSILNQKVNLSFSGSFDPYVTLVRDSISGGQIQKYIRQINRYTWQDGRFPTLRQFTFSMSSSLNSSSFSPKKAPMPVGTSMQTMSADQAQRLALMNGDPGAYIDFNVPWNISLNYSYNYANNYSGSTTANTLMISGDVSITQKWKIQYNTTYDIKAGKLSDATSFAIYRDLHCWDLSINWLPFGFYKSYNVTLKVKSTILQDLKLSKRSDYTNNPGFN
ncbi:putative LPS assembly protein LptD [Mucilaginibacter sp. 21P]|uniref:putative LPS assembly protein LptD n=1 Tax=Mucilaginibacter sp. 21P TaxID=2778902 RepID=UPI002102E776|nr:putative LPS assembly protein LptD [Mucilaginibacter sp. 21P]